MLVSQLQDQVVRGEYRVDAQAVADAIIRRLMADRGAGTAAVMPPQSECS